MNKYLANKKFLKQIKGALMSKHHSDFQVLNAQVLQQLQALKKAQSIFDQQIDPNWRGKCQVTPFKAPQLTVIVDTSSLASRLRGEADRLVKALARESCFYGIKTLHFKINQHLKFAPLKIPKVLTFKSEHKEVILHSAKLIKDEKIKEILHRLIADSENG